MTETVDRSVAAPPRTVLELRDVTKLDGRKIILNRLSGRFAAGELTQIVGPRGAGKSLLAKLISGQKIPDAGQIVATTLPAPQISSAWGIAMAGSVERGLGTVAAAYGIDSGAYTSAVAALLDNPHVLSSHLRSLGRAERTLVTFAASYLVPSDIYIADGSLLPTAAELRARLEPLYLSVRSRAAILLFSGDPATGNRFDPDRRALLHHGQLSFYPDFDSLSEAFTDIAAPLKGSAAKP